MNSDIFSNSNRELLGEPLTKGERTKIEILKAALSLYSAKGIHRVTFEMIGEASGRSRQVVRSHFKTQDDLLSTVAKFIRASFVRYVLKKISSLEEGEPMLIGYVEACFDWTTDERHNAKVWHSFLAKCTTDRDNRALNTEFSDIGEQRIVQMLKAANPNQTMSPQKWKDKAKTIQILIAGGMIFTVTENRDVTHLKKIVSSQCQGLANA